jgi:glucosamine-phosphate N-acetyltransferase
VEQWANNIGDDLGERLAKNNLTYVAVEQEKVIGTASLLIETKLIHNGSKVGHIEDVAVHPAHQGKGIGKALVDHLVECCRNADCYKVILDCKEGVAPFYEKLGFHRHEIAMRLDLKDTK